MSNSQILISTVDRERLMQLMDSARLDQRITPAHIAALEGELARARVVEPDELPVDVVSMDSTVWIHDLGTDEFEQYTLVVPSEADVLRDRISVLAPIGTALLGYRLGDVIEWSVPTGKRRMEIVKVTQPRPDANPLPDTVGV